MSKIYAFQIDENKIPRFGNFIFVKHEGLTNMTKEIHIKELEANGWQILPLSEYRKKLKEHTSHIGQSIKFFVSNP